MWQGGVNSGQSSPEARFALQPLIQVTRLSAESVSERVLNISTYKQACVVFSEVSNWAVFDPTLNVSNLHTYSSLMIFFLIIQSGFSQWLSNSVAATYETTCSSLSTSKFLCVSYYFTVSKRIFCFHANTGMQLAPSNFPRLTAVFLFRIMNYYWLSI